ncbi:MAG: hypothetical protein JO211_17365, partial [Acidobacteriaceae bacterium]|nr:hypothetical protein [Acidobacteriaceae bacterium]
MKFSFALLILLSPLAVLGQDTAPATTGTVTNPNPIVTLAGSFLEHNFFNFYAYGNGVYDTFAPIEQNGNFTNGGSFGYEVGGGVNGNHAFRNGNFSISYQGGYRNYQSNLYGSGTYQNLGMSLVKRFSRRWTFSWTTGAGIYLYGGSFFTPEMNGSPSVVTNPFSSE